MQDPDDADRDRDGDVDERHDEEALRSLLDAVEPGAGLVQQRDQQAGAGHQPEPVVAVAEERRSSDGCGQRSHDGQGDTRRTAEGDRRARDREARVALALRCEAEERVDEAQLRDRRAHRDERDDLAGVGHLVLAQVARVDRQQQHTGEAGDDRSDAVDRRLAGQRSQARAGSAAVAHGSSYSTWS